MVPVEPTGSPKKSINTCYSGKSSVVMLCSVRGASRVSRVPPCDGCCDSSVLGLVRQRFTERRKLDELHSPPSLMSPAKVVVEIRRRTQRRSFHCAVPETVSKMVLRMHANKNHQHEALELRDLLSLSPSFLDTSPAAVRLRSTATQDARAKHKFHLQLAFEDEQGKREPVPLPNSGPMQGKLPLDQTTQTISTLAGTRSTTSWTNQSNW